MGVKNLTACHVVGMRIVLPKRMLSCSHRSFQNHCELHHILGVHVFIISWKIVFNGLVGFDTFHSSVAFERHKCPFCKDALVVHFARAAEYMRCARSMVAANDVMDCALEMLG